MLNSFLTDPVSLHLIRTGLVKTRFHPIFFLGRGVFTSIFEFREIVLMVSFGFCWIFFQNVRTGEPGAHMYPSGGVAFFQQERRL